MQYTITLKSSGHCFTCQSKESLLDAALRQGVALTSGCRHGICGVCIGTLHRGSIQYAEDDEPMAFFAEDNEDEHGKKRIVICEAMPTSDLVLDMHEIDSAQTLDQKNLQASLLQITKLSENITELKLALPEDEYLQFLPGQTVSLVTEDNTKLSYAPANAPKDGRTITLHINNKRLATSLSLEELSNTPLRIEGPKGDFFLHTDSKKDLIFICQAEGFAAISSMTKQLISRTFSDQSTKSSSPKLTLFWLGETEEDLYQQQLVKSWSKQYTNIHFSPIINSAIQSNKNANVIKQLLTQLSNQFKYLSDHDIYISASAKTVDEIEFELLSQASQVNIYYQRF